MTFTLGPRAAKAGYRIREYECVDSTNSEALRLARSGETGPLWIVTREQTAGRGRRGREWMSAPGNLAASVLIREAIRPQAAATLGFAASLAACHACRELARGIDFKVKWPNDVLANGRKVAGILLESESQPGTLSIVTGFGINLAEAPSNTAFPAASLAGLGKSIPPQTALTTLTDLFSDLLILWREDFAAIRRLWLDSAHGVGEAVSIRVGERTESGVFETLDEQGRLMLRRTDNTLEAISAGDVYFGSVASAGAMA